MDRLARIEKLVEDFKFDANLLRGEAESERHDETRIRFLGKADALDDVVERIESVLEG
jgi:hypothetical protein